MMPAQLRETTMDPRQRSLLRVIVVGQRQRRRQSAPKSKTTETLVESLMGRKPELRFQFIQENARFAQDVDV